MLRVLHQASPCSSQGTLVFYGSSFSRRFLLFQNRITGNINERQGRHSKRTISTQAAWAVDPQNGFVTRRLSEDSNMSKDPLYQVIVGLEIHAQLDIPTKLFSSAPSAAQRRSQSIIPNTLLHPFDVAAPGYLPTLSKSAVQQAVLAAAALNCEVQPISRFERKHYSYADLPHSYQITQQRWPLALNGNITCQSTSSTLPVASKDKKTKQQSQSSISVEIVCRIERLQLECDTAKTIVTKHIPWQQNAQKASIAPLSSSSWSLIDFTRAGTALIEIVTAPDLRSSRQAGAVVTHIRQLLKHAHVCTGKMQQGQLRIDVNVNLQRLADQTRNARVEVKNLNSIQQVIQAIDYEATRQAQEWIHQDVFVYDNNHAEISVSDKSNNITNVSLPLGETRTWNVIDSCTELIRRKDASDDYRFMPEPDLPPLILNEKTFNGVSLEQFIQQNLPELASAAIQRLQNDYGISTYQANVIARDPSAIQFVDDAMKFVPTSGSNEVADFAKIVSNLICNELFALVKDKAESHGNNVVGIEYFEDDDDASVTQSTVSASQLGELARMQHQGTISSTMAKKILSILFEAADSSFSPRQVAADHGLELISDPVQLHTISRQVIAEHPEEVNVYRKGGKFVTKMQKLFTGKVMTVCRGNAHPERLREAVEQALEEAASSK
jgi:aspartyl-tRNA(Asn)/glutamyl-tRNA(Gln) amidotransferase subunit B